MQPGFSYVGFLYLLMLMVPNLFWTKRKPADYEKYVIKESKVLLAFERLGEGLVTCTALMFSDFNVRCDTIWSGWLVLSFVLMVMYEIFWIRYFRSEKQMKDFYRDFLKIPVAGATLPVMAFLLLGIYGSNSIMMVSSSLLGIGHIGIHLAHQREVCAPAKKKGKVRKILKAAGIGAAGLLLAANLLVIGVRNYRYLGHYANFLHGVDECRYLSIGGQKQYVLMTGKNVKNPVIVYLHGGPSSPDSMYTYYFADHLTDAFTFVCWDQRGCGRTYFKNKNADPENETATFEQAKSDLDELVDYVCERFGQEQVIIMGHSYGTILGSMYVKEHPEKVSAYLAVAQVTSLEKTDVYSYEDALKKAREAGKDTFAMEEAYAVFRENPSLENLMVLRRLVSDYHPVHIEDNELWHCLTSPYFGVDDFKWFLQQLGGFNEYYELNRQLFDYTFGFDVYEEETDYQVPVYFISGTDDWICPVDSVQDYYQTITAPDKGIYLMEGCSHNTQYAKPKEFAGIVRKIMRERAQVSGQTDRIISESEENTEMKRLFERQEITSFEKISLRTSGMRSTELYEILWKDTGAELSFYRMNYANRKEEQVLEKRVICDKEEILKLLNQCRILSWDGFHGEHPRGVLDGTMFSFEAIVDDGRQIRADGSQNFPTHYRDFTDTLNQWLRGD